MNTEFEVAYANIDHNAIRNIIRNLGWKCIQERTLMKRVIFKPTGKELQAAYFRVRDEWNKITCTYKAISDGELNINSVKEVETQVKDFDAMIEILSLSWLQKIASQESYRETWQIWKDIEFMLDEWPWIKPFLEIEWKNEAIVQKYSQKLWLDYKSWIFWWVDQIYFQEVWIPCDVVNNLPEISFENPPMRDHKLDTSS